MRICIFGAGSLGSALGGILARSNQVTLVGRRAHVSAVRRDGLRLTGDVRRVVRVDARERAERLEPPELLIVTTKAYDTPTAIEACRDIASRNTMVLTLQNGLGNLEQLRTWKGTNALGGTTTLGANLVAPGKVRVSGLGQTVIGTDLNPTGAREICEAFCESGLATRTERDINTAIWSKVAVSAAINPLTAALRVENGKLLESKAMRRMVTEVCLEAVAVGILDGAVLDSRKSAELVCSVVRDTSENRSSMLQDVDNRKRTEIDQINGAIWRLGDKLGSPAPLNRALWAMISSMESPLHREKA